MKQSCKKIFMDGLLHQNPVLVQLLGVCSILAVTTSLENALGMSLAVTIVLTLSNMVISLLRKIIPNEVRIVSYIVVIAGFVTVVDLLMQAFLPALANSLGIFIPLIVVNCIILARAEAFASKNGILASAVDGLGMGLGYSFVIAFVGLVREILGSGTILGFELFGGFYQPCSMFIMPAGAFIVLGCTIALYQAIHLRIEVGKEGKK